MTVLGVVVIHDLPLISQGLTVAKAFLSACLQGRATMSAMQTLETCAALEDNL
jgi:hypothetical protein